MIQVQGTDGVSLTTLEHVHVQSSSIVQRVSRVTRTLEGIPVAYPIIRCCVFPILSPSVCLSVCLLPSLSRSLSLSLSIDFGVLILLCSVVHSACHIAVGALQRRADHAFKNEINRSGLVAVLLLLPIALPMTMGLAKAKVRSRFSCCLCSLSRISPGIILVSGRCYTPGPARGLQTCGSNRLFAAPCCPRCFARDDETPQLTFEVRKYLHLLFIPFMIAVCFHGRPLQILGAILLAWYLLDRLYFTTKMSVSPPSARVLVPLV